MRSFYLSLWLSWLFRVVLCTLATAFLLASLVTLLLYAKEGFVHFNGEVADALFSIWKFWFSILLNIALLFALFRSIKYIFNRCYSGYMLKLKNCPKDDLRETFIDVVGYGDLIKVWRKWFFALIWLSGALMVLAFVVTKLFTSYSSLFSWFSIYLLYLFIALSGYLSFVFISARCKNIKVVKC